MRSNFLFFLAPLFGIFCGIVSTQFFLIGWLNLVFWGLVALGIGSLCKTRKEVIWSGVLYGFSLSISFLFSGFHGTSDKQFGFVLFSLFLGAIGIGCGLIGVSIGHMIRKRIGPH